MAFCKFRVMDRCTKSQQPCLFDEECFEPQDEPIPMTCINFDRLMRDHGYDAPDESGEDEDAF